jgi:23S rRNA (uracil1939-C5)-methyltransferase
VQHLPHDEQLALKQRMLAEQLSRVAGVEPEEWAAPLSGPEFGYRRRARVAVRWDMKKKLEVGLAPPAARTSSPSTNARCWYSPCSRS